MKKWVKLPQIMQTEEVKKYYDILKKKKISRFFKRIFDMLVSLLMLIILLPIFLILSIIIKLTSRGPVFYRQVRITRYNKTFRIFKFRTMVANADKIGSLVTVKNDNRITKVGKFLRKTRLDELPQLLNILFGQMTFVGTRPEVKKYVDSYTNEMYATLLMPAGVTSPASIKYKDENDILDNCSNIDETYVNVVLPEKMKYNFEYLIKFNFFKDIYIMFWTFFSVIK